MTNPDVILAGTDQIVVSADSVVLDRCQSWFNMAREVVSLHVAAANVVDLSGGVDR